MSGEAAGGPDLPRIIRRATCRVMPWKNGGGSTTEIAVSPPGVALDRFDWRVSMADVASDGPFSTFPGIDRTLAILSGEGLLLDIEGRPAVALRQADAPLGFPADVPTSSRLLGGPVTDLNVMTRRGAFSHTMRWLDAEVGQPVPVQASLVLILAAGGAWEVADGTDIHQLGERDVLVTGAGVRSKLTSLSACRLCIAEIRPA